MVVLLAAGAGVLLGRLTGGAPQEAGPAGPQPSRSVPARAYAQLQGVLTARGNALLRRNKTAFLAVADPASAGFRAAQARLFDNLAKLPFGSLSYAVDPGRPLTLPAAATARYGGAPAVAALVHFTSALTGFDLGPSVEAQSLTFVQRDGRWYLASDSDLDGTDQPTTRGLWDLEPISILRSERALVVYGASQKALAQRVSAGAQRAARRVAAVWPSGWTGRAVIAVPSTGALVRRLVPAETDLTHLAALTTADSGASAGPPAGTRVVVNPPAFQTLTRVGSDVLLAHEITHVATRRTTTVATPYWLAEGFADYVGYANSGLSVRSAARELAAEVAAGRVPGQLPTREDFAGANPRLAGTYQSAWLACRLIAARAGQDGLVRFYRIASTDSDTAFRQVLGMTAEQFVAAWQAYLRSELG